MTKVSSEDSERMKYKITRDLSMSDISVRQNLGDDCLLLDTPKGSVYLFCNTSTNDVDSLIRRQQEAMQKGAVANIFYKDGENFFVLLEGDPMWQRVSGSLKNLSQYDIKHLVYLREKERLVLEGQGENRDLIYYQPSTIPNGGRLQEGLVKFEMSPIRKDYSHISSDRTGYEHIMEGHGQNFRKIVRASNSAEKLEGKLTFRPLSGFSNRVILSSIKVEQPSLF